MLRTFLAGLEPPPDPRRGIVLADLEPGPMSAGDLRHHLRTAGEMMNGPRFFRFMAGMEVDGLVEGYYVAQVIDGMIFWERWYRKIPKSNQDSM